MKDGRFGSAAARGALATVLLLAAGCGVDRDYDAALRANTIVAFDDYLRLHPDGAHAADARTHLAALVEDREWQRAQSRASVDAYQQYLRGYPGGAHAKDALQAIADFNMAALPSTEAAPGPAPPPASTAAGAPRGAIVRPPAPTPAPPLARASAPAVAATETRGVRLQLGAFGGEAAARAAWKRIGARHPELASHALMLSPATLADGRRIERLQLGGFDRDSAAAACAVLAKGREPCLVIPPAGAESH